MSIFKLSFWLDLIFPINCLSCGDNSKSYLCPTCFKNLNFRGEVKGVHYQNINKIFAVSNYKDKLAPLLMQAYKFKSVKAISNILAEYLRIFWQSRILFSKASYVVVPIPLSSRRLRQRGYNQVELIATIFAKEFNYSLNLNLRRKNRKAQSSLNAKKRKSNILNSFYFKGENLKGASIIILDDVLTTGATVSEAARVLKQAGAGEIVVIAIFKS